MVMMLNVSVVVFVADRPLLSRPKLAANIADQDNSVSFEGSLFFHNLAIATMTRNERRREFEVMSGPSPSTNGVPRGDDVR